MNKQPWWWSGDYKVPGHEVQDDFETLYEVLASTSQYADRKVLFAKRAAAPTIFHAGTLVKVIQERPRKYGFVADASDIANACGVLLEPMDLSKQDKERKILIGGFVKAGSLRWADGTVLTADEVLNLASTWNATYLAYFDAVKF